jgi:lysophospholipase
MVITTEKYFVFGNYTIYYRIHRAENTRADRGFLFFHGRGVHSKYLEHIIDDTLSSRYTFFSFDYPGHGRSSGPRCDVDLFKELPPLIEYFIEEVVLKSGIKKIFLMGESLGAVVAFFAQRLIRTKIECKGLIFMPGIYEVDSFNSSAELAVLYFLRFVAPRLRIKNKRSLQGLTDVPEFQGLIMNDPYLYRFGTIRYLFSIYRFVRYMQKNLNAADLPLLIFNSAHDYYTDETLVNEYFYHKFPPGPHKRLVMLKNSIHWLLIGGDLDIIKKELFQWCADID